MSEPRNMLRDGRNIIPVSNSDAKCLLENWVEERAVKDIDQDIQLEGPITSKLQILRHGHKGVLTTDFDAKAEDKTTVRVTYTPPMVDTTRKVGSKKELMEQMYYGEICKKRNVDPGPEPTDFRSVKMVDYDFKFTPQRIPPTRGLTAVKTRDSAFRRNDSFTKPIWEWWEEPLPYDLENYPMM